MFGDGNGGCATDGVEYNIDNGGDSGVDDDSGSGDGDGMLYVYGRCGIRGRGVNCRGHDDFRGETQELVLGVNSSGSCDEDGRQSDCGSVACNGDDRASSGYDGKDDGGGCHDEEVSTEQLLRFFG